ncbi:hypothetical protein [Conexibacter sp. SYSU D00693]|uniref:hypothetical protein n=1 Tax=Conexibacter sp. SYSU D00693 TaxID=2812560 RepID=UPI00196B76AD|nr:hypothetical protein [Conexibacter sp. SYSU D00693]
MSSTIWVMAIVLLLSGFAVASALGGLTSAGRAKEVDRAQAAADAGADIAGYRMSKTLLAPGADGLLGYVGGTLRTVGCVGANLDYGSTSSIPAQPSGAGAPAAGALAALPTVGKAVAGLIPDGKSFCRTTTDEQLGDGASFRYAISTAVQLPASVTSLLTTPVGSLVVRQVAAIGRAGGAQRRVIVSYWLSLDEPTAPFVRRRYVRCPAQPSNPSDPFSGCPANPGY